MVVQQVQSSMLDTFRAVWVRDRLEYQRALEALDEAMRFAEEIRAQSEAPLGEEVVRQADQNIESARQRLADVQATLERLFDQFCGGLK